MKGRMILVAAALLVLTAWSMGPAETVVVSGHPEYPPIMWREGDTIIGVGPELVKRAFGDLGVSVDCIFAGNWAQVQEAQKKGTVDVLAGVYLTEERKAAMEYSVPYTQDPVVLFVAKGKAFPFNKWEDLIGKRGTTTTGDSYGQKFDSFITAKLTMERAATVQENFEKLLSGKADYFIFAMYSGNFEARKLNILDKIEQIKKPATVEDFYISVGKGSKYVSLLPELNRKIERMAKDGTVESLIKKYTTQYEKALTAPPATK